MCSIVGSIDLHDLDDLAKLNAHRGQMNHSLMCYHPYDMDGRAHIVQGSGPFEVDPGLLEWAPMDYYILHHQAPTTQSLKQHPAIGSKGYLFHNGIIKDRYLDVMRHALNTDEQWDTLLLLRMIERYGYGCLSDIDGSFACVHVTDDGIFIFRNALAPLFIDDKYNISSTIFDGARPVEQDKVINLLTSEVVYDFSTNDDVYFYG